MELELDKCHYCGSFTKDENSFYVYTMYGVIKSNLIRGTGYTFKKKKINIPRCRRCSSEHNKLSTYIDLPVFLIAFIITIWFFTTKISDDGFNFLSILPAIVVGAVALGVIAPIFRAMAKKMLNVKTTENTNIEDYVEIKNLLKMGWKLEKPAKSAVISDDDLIITSPYKK